MAARNEPLAAPRDDGLSEVGFVRDQARFYAAMADSFGNSFTMRYELQPACFMCGSPDVVHRPSDLSYVCDRCGAKSAADVLRAGRIAKR